MFLKYLKKFSAPNTNLMLFGVTFQQNFTFDFNFAELALFVLRIDHVRLQGVESLESCSTFVADEWSEVRVRLFVTFEAWFRREGFRAQVARIHPRFMNFIHWWRSTNLRLLFTLEAIATVGRVIVFFIAFPVALLLYDWISSRGLYRRLSLSIFWILLRANKTFSRWAHDLLWTCHRLDARSSTEEVSNRLVSTISYSF